MLPHSFRDLPKVRDSLSYLYFERGRITQTKLGIEYVNKAGRTLIPVAALTVLLLGPGTTVTHAAVRTLARVGCSVCWVGEEGVRFYAQGLGETHKAYKTKITIPVAFATVAENPTNLERTVRKRCRQAFRNMKLLKRILPDIEAVLDVEGDPPLPDGFDPDDDPALPPPWWEPSGDGDLPPHARLDVDPGGGNDA